MFVVTFYSFKGGVGRTMSLVNVACELSRTKKVLIVDFDLEAPGLSTFSPCAASQHKRGLVEYFMEYRSTNRAPSVSNYIYQCDPKAFASLESDDIARPNPEIVGQLHVMPAGDMQSAFNNKFWQIDFLDLYENRHGYLLLEDLKAQWGALGFDYVLVDSRTGHTDSGGICTRQLPDAIVAVFSPNEQNLVGLQTVVEEVRKDTIRHKPEFIFVASRVPQLDDEHGLLEKMMRRFRKALAYDSEDFTRIHNYDSLALVEQEVFVYSRPRTRLANEYRRLARMITALNAEDSEGAIAYLETVSRREPFEDRNVNTGRLNRIEEMHKANAKIMFRAAVVHYERRELELAVASIDAAYAASEKEDELVKASILGLRVRIFRAVNQLEEAKHTAYLCLQLENASRIVLRDALRTILELDSGSLADPEQVYVFNKVPARTLTAVAVAMTFSRNAAQYGAKLIRFALRKYGAELESTENYQMVLTLIGGGLFEEAIAVLQRLKFRDGGSLVLLFNHAMAEWGLTGRPNDELLRAVKLRFEETEEKELNELDEANVSQCMAVIYTLLADQDKARTLLEAARRRIQFALTSFSCWSYLPSNKATFERHCAMIEKFILDRSVVPLFISENPRLVHH